MPGTLENVKSITMRFSFRLAHACHRTSEDTQFSAVSMVLYIQGLVLLLI